MGNVRCLLPILLWNVHVGLPLPAAALALDSIHPSVASPAQYSEASFPSLRTRRRGLGRVSPPLWSLCTVWCLGSRPYGCAWAVSLPDCWQLLPTDMRSSPEGLKEAGQHMLPTPNAAFRKPDLVSSLHILSQSSLWTWSGPVTPLDN